MRSSALSPHHCALCTLPEISSLPSLWSQETLYPVLEEEGCVCFGVCVGVTLPFNLQAGPARPPGSLQESGLRTLT